MACVQFEGQNCELQDGESVLEGLLRQGLAIPHSCRAGSCGSCLLRAVAGHVPERAQAGLKDSWRAQGYFLSCLCRPESDLVVSAAGDAQVPASISGLERLSHDVLRVRLTCEAALEFRAGQYITLLRADGLARSYSVASLPEEGDLELHVRRLPQGRMSGWLHEEARVGDRLRIQGPLGECFYVPGRADQPLLLVGTGTGLAPLWGIARDALRQGHTGAIHIFHGAVRPAGLYLTEELRGLAQEHPHVEYTPAVLLADDTPHLAAGPIDEVLRARYPRLNGWRAFLCGDPALVQKLKKQVFLAGAGSRDIFADAFVSAPAVP